MWRIKTRKNKKYVRINNNIRVFILESNAFIFDCRGVWGEIKKCDSNMAICGMKVRMGDTKTALNGAKFKCCDFSGHGNPSPDSRRGSQTDYPLSSFPSDYKDLIEPRSGLSGISLIAFLNSQYILFNVIILYILYIEYVFICYINL